MLDYQSFIYSKVIFKQRWQLPPTSNQLETSKLRKTCTITCATSVSDPPLRPPNTTKPLRCSGHLVAQKAGMQAQFPAGHLARRQESPLDEWSQINECLTDVARLESSAHLAHDKKQAGSASVPARRRDGGGNVSRPHLLLGRDLHQATGVDCCVSCCSDGEKAC